MTRIRLCPICRRPASNEAAPFCSPRCQDVDLHRWFSGGYAIPGQTQEEEDGSAGGSEPPA